MKCLHVFADDSGTSHLGSIELALNASDLAPPAPPLDISPPEQAVRCFLLRAPAGWFGDWHPAPTRQYFYCVSGEVEVHSSDGDSVRFRAGEVALVEDTTGKGHTTRVTSEVDFVAGVVQLE